MKLVAVILVSIALVACANTEFLAYSGAQQKWPTAPGSVIDTKRAIPVYYGLPPRPYKVLGEIAASQGQTWLWSDVESEAMDNAAQEAKKHGADAVIVTKRDASVAGSVSTGTASIVGNTVLATGGTTAVQTGHVRVTAIKFL